MKNALASAALKSESPEPRGQEPQQLPEDRSPADRWRTAVDDIAVDALARSDRYPAESLVPEGGE